MAVFNNILNGASGQTAGGADAGYQIERSLRFEGNTATSYLSKNDYTADSNRQTFTLSLWVKKSATVSNQRLFGLSGTNQFSVMFTSQDQLSFYANLSTGTAAFDSAARYRDFSAWYHIVLAFDTTASGSDKMKVYVNGEEMSFATSTLPTDNANFYWGDSALYHYIGRYSSGTAYFYNGYMADIHYVDGQQLNQYDFGEFDANGVWQPIEYTGTYGTNGFHLDFSDNSSASALGTDSSGNGNDWTVNNLDHQTESNSINFDPTSTPFEDTGSGLTVSNPGANGDSVGTTNAGSNSFNLGTVADFTVSNGRVDINNVTIPDEYTIDYYWKSESANQESNATVVDFDGEEFRDYGTATSRTIRLRKSSSYQFAYTAVSGWNHIRITQSGVWHNGNSLSGTIYNLAGFTGNLAIGHYPSSTDNRYCLNGLIGPVRIAPKDLGAPASGGLVANSDGTLSNLTASNPNCDSLFDSPTNGTQEDTGAGGEVSGNYVTYNPLKEKTGGYTMAYADGNLELSGGGDGVGTFPFGSGKKYFELTIKSASAFSQGYYGIVDINQTGPRVWTTSEIAAFRDTGSLYGTGSTGAAPAASQVGDVIGFAVDVDNQKLFISVNGTYLNSADPAAGTGFSFSGRDFSNYAPLASISAGNSQVIVLNAGQRPFDYTAPSGFKALCTANLDDPDILDGSTQMDVSLYSGTGSAQPITGLNFAPDFVWGKRKNGTASHVLMDTVRGETVYLRTDTANTDTSNTNVITSFNSDGFTLGTSSALNTSTGTYVAWTWKGGGTAVSNTNGSITSSVSANPSAGFSIVTYTGISGSSKTIGHGLNAEPELIIAKARTTASPADWTVGCKHLANGWNEYGFMTATTWTGSSVFWNDGTNNSSTVFSVGNYPTNSGNGIDYVAYCFASVEGYSKVGVYKGNGLTSGTFVYCGFRPRYLMIKNTDSATNWITYDTARDTYNDAENRIFPNSNLSEGVLSGIDILSNGFRPIAANGTFNGNGNEHVFLAFAENPFKYTRAR